MKEPPAQPPPSFPDPATDRLLRLLRGNFDDSMAILSEPEWREILEATRRHGIGPLVFHAIRKNKLDRRVPPSIRTPLRQAYLATAVSNARRFHFLSEIAAAFQARSIPLILLKGAHLAQFVYPDAALRPMSDIDILVPAVDLNRAADCLFELGYGFRDYGTWQVAPGKSGHYPIPSDQMHFRTLHHPTAGIMVELHCAITYAESPFTIDMEGIWDRARPVRMETSEALIMHPEDLLLHLCHHLAYQHRFDAMSLRALCDIGVLLDTAAASIDRERLLRRARGWRIHRALFLCLHLARRLLHVDLAEFLLEKALPGEIDPNLADGIQAWFLSDGARVDPPPPYLPGLKETGSIKGGIRYLLKALFPKKEVIGVRYLVPPASRRVYLYYGVRMIDYLRDHTGDLWRVLRRDPGARTGMDRSIEEDRLRRWLEGS